MTSLGGTVDRASRIRSRRAAAIVACLAVVAGGAGLLAVQPASGVASFTLTRLAGPDRYATSALVAERAFATAPTVILATGANYPDALAASFLAGNLGAPVLLTTPDLPLSPSTTGALTALKTKNVVILGGTSAVSQAEQDSLTQTASSAGGNLAVTRIAGASRYDTMAAIDTRAGTTVGMVNGKKTALLATGLNFPDALGGAPVAYADKLPIVLTPTDSVAPQASAVLKGLGIQQVLILGGANAISAGVEAAVNQMGIATLQRFSGADRSQTSALLADYAIANLGFKNTLVNVASGDQAFGGADALSLGPLGGSEDPVATIVTNGAGSPGSTVTFAAEHNATLTGGLAVGGTVPLPASDLAAIDTAGQGVSSTSSTTSPSTTIPAGATGSATPCGTATVSSGSGSAPGSGTTLRPDLSSVSFVSIHAVGSLANPAGTTLTFTFDHPVNGGLPNPADFELVPFNTTGAHPVVAGSTATIQSGNLSVNVLFNTILSQGQLNLYTVAAVLPNAVVEPANPPTTTVALTNPEGAAPIGTPVAPIAGKTDSPNLVSATLRAFSTTDVAIDLTLDCGATTTTAGVGTFSGFPGLRVVLLDNTPAACMAPDNGNTAPSGGNVAGGIGTTVITIICPPAGAGRFAGQALSTANVARVYVDSGALADAAAPADQTPLESVKIGNGSLNGQTGSATAVPPIAGGPDLTSVAFAPNVNLAPPGGPVVDQVTYTFDKPLLAGTAPADFQVFRADGSEIGSAGPAVVQGGAMSVLVNYPQGTLVNAVGGSVLAGAVTGTNGNPSWFASAGAAGETAAELTTAPDLVSASPVSASSVSFTFDKTITVVSPGLFRIYNNDATGTSQPCGAFTIGGTNNTVVTCTGLAPYTTPALATVAVAAVSGTSGPNTSPFSASA